MVAMDSTRAELAHLYRRAGFGARPEELDAALDRGYQASVDLLVAPPGADAGAVATPPPELDAEPRRLGKQSDRAAKRAYRIAHREQGEALVQWWLARMVAVDQPLAEKLALLWHGHWATSIRKVHSARLMLGQNQTLRSLGVGDFRELARAMVRDPALLIWLDARRNSKTLPNENLSRELIELFTLGIGHYAEDDVREAARALTGWRIDRRTGAARLVAALHDDRPKTVLAHTGDLDDRSLVDLLVAQQASARFVVTRLWQRLVLPTPPPDDVMGRLLAAYGPGRDVRALVRAMLLDPVFRSAAARHALVKQPIEYVVGALRALHVHPAPPVSVTLLRLGQQPFQPPSVGGWPTGAAWLSSSAAQARVEFAEWVARQADLSVLAHLAPAARIDAVARLLSVDAWTPRTRTALAAASPDVEQLVTLALVAPEYVVN